MLVLPINPGIGAGPIRLGMSKLEARRTLEDLGYPLSAEHGESDYFCENALQLEYEGGCLRFIGISNHQEIKCTFGIVDVFDCAAPELFRLFATGETRPLSAAPGETCFFPSQGLNLWESDEQYDHKAKYTRKVYAQIGIERLASAQQAVAADGQTASRARRKCAISLCTCGARHTATRRR